MPLVELKFSSINSSAPQARKFEGAGWVKRRMYGLEKFLGISYKGFEEEAPELFSAFESNQKVSKYRWALVKSKQGVGGKGFRNFSGCLAQ
jgi:hypothetical protein